MYSLIQVQLKFGLAFHWLQRASKCGSYFGTSSRFGSNALNYALLKCFKCFQTEGQSCITTTLQSIMWKSEICTNADWNQKLNFLCKYNLWLTLHLSEHCVKSCCLKFVIWSRRVKYKHYLYKKITLFIYRFLSSFQIYVQTKVSLL